MEQALKQNCAYIGFVASYLLFHLTLTGYTFAHLWPTALRWNSFAISTFTATKSTEPAIDKALEVLNKLHDKGIDESSPMWKDKDDGTSCEVCQKGAGEDKCKNKLCRDCCVRQEKKCELHSSESLHCVFLVLSNAYVLTTSRTQI